MATQIRDETANAVKDVADQASQTTAELADQALGTGERQLTSRKDQAAEQATHLAEAMRKVSGEMEQNEAQQATAQLVASGAEQIDKVANYLRSTSVSQMVGGLEDVARSQPAIFLGSAFTLGLIGARFLKAGSASRQQPGMGTAGYWRASPGYQGRYAPAGYADYRDGHAGYRGPSRYGAAEEDAWSEPAEGSAYDRYRPADEPERGI